jgi:hypothetical protein
MESLYDFIEAAKNNMAVGFVATLRSLGPLCNGIESNLNGYKRNHSRE